MAKWRAHKVSGTSDENHSALTDEDHHPNDLELRRYCAGLDAEELIFRIDCHVLNCETCFPKVVALVRESIASTNGRNQVPTL